MPTNTTAKRGKSVVPYIAFGTEALAAVAFSTAAVTGTIGTAEPQGRSRDQIQKDLERRERYASTANVLLVTGGVLAGVYVVSFMVPWD